MAHAIVNPAGESAGERFRPADDQRRHIRDSRISRPAVVEQSPAKVKPKVVIQSSGIGHYGSRTTSC
jgi:NAD dependent epimerase/dehydratase family enzyme